MPLWPTASWPRADPYYLHLLIEGLSENDLLERNEAEIDAVARRSG